MVFNLETAIVRIVAPNDNIVGTGFVLTDDGLIATCAHVVADAGVGPGETVNFVFHCTGEERQAVVEAGWWRKPEAEDVAILKLIGELAEPVKPLLLGTSAGAATHLFETMGFPPTSPIGGILGSGTILGQTKINEMPVLQLRSQEVTGGFSGAPVWDCTTCRVVGMVTSITVPDRYGRLAETVFITPTETLRSVCPALQLSGLCPYRSLEAFTEADAEFFFGREQVVERLAESLRREPRFLAVLGPSGCGKSSLVQAGLIPYLRRGAVPGSDRWGVIVARPADQPFHQLEAQGLTGARKDLSGTVQSWLESRPERERLVLVLDQFEDLLVAGPEDLRQAFLAQLTKLLEAPSPVTLVLVMRDDFYSRFAREMTDLVAWMERRLVNVPPTLMRAELQDIVEGPAHAVGVTFEAGLVEDILKDTLESAAAGEGQVGRSTILPLLEFALTQLWKWRQDGVLTHKAYETIGGVTGGLTQWADRAYYGLGKGQQWLARRVLTDLVHLGDESQGLPDSRQRRSLDALSRDKAEREMVHQVVRRLANERLLVTGRDLQSRQETVELIHDALLREWGLLREWLRDDRRFLAWRQGIERRIRGWIESSPDDTTQRDEDRLLRGRELAEAEVWLSKRENSLKRAEVEYIQASAKDRELREQEEEERRFLQWRLQLQNSILVWNQTNHQGTLLLSGDALAEAERWLEKRHNTLNKDEQAYIESSINRMELLRQGKLRRWVFVLIGFSFVPLVFAVLQPEDRCTMIGLFVLFFIVGLLHLYTISRDEAKAKVR